MRICAKCTSDLLKASSVGDKRIKCKKCAKGTTHLLGISVTGFMDKVQLCAKGTTNLLRAWKLKGTRIKCKYVLKARGLTKDIVS